MLIDKSLFSEKSVKFLRNKNIPFTDETVFKVYEETISFLKANDGNPENLSNKSLVKALKLIFKQYNISVKTTEIYELFSKIFGEKNWNILLSKNVVFANYFKEFNQYRRIPTGIDLLDKDLGGGLQRQQLAIMISGTNIGKTRFGIKMASKLLKNKNRNFKILHINLEGSLNSTENKYLSELSQIPLNRINKGDLSSQEWEIVEEFKKSYSSQLLIKNLAGKFDNTVEKVIDYCTETYKTFKFDFVFLDCGQLLKTEKGSVGFGLEMKEVFFQLAAMSRTFDCAVLSPVQATRDYTQSFKENLNYSTGDVSHNFEIARMSGTIMSLNCIEDDLKNSTRTVYLEKQNLPIRDKTYKMDFQ